MIQLKLIPELEDPRIQAASGLLTHADELFLVCDDQFGIYRKSQKTPWSFYAWSLAPNTSHLSSEDLKKIKYDFECLSINPENQRELFLFPSGSTPQRNTGLCYHLSDHSLTPFDCLPLYQSLAKGSGNLNIEGCAFFHDHLLLLNRGVANYPSEIFVIDFKPMKLLHSYPIDFPTQASYPTHGTELFVKEGKIYTLFSAEQTSNSYDDGPVLGSGIARLNSETFQVEWYDYFDLPVKTEGLTFWNHQFLTSTDPDGKGISQFYVFDL